MFLGNVGAIDHYEYRPTGDIVNTASRIEGLNKYLNTEKLVSRDVLDQLDGFLTRELGTFLLVGKSRPVTVYELICQIGDCSEQQEMLCTTFNKALFAYRSRSWEEAGKWFYESKNIHGKDGPSAFYLKLCEQYRESPPMEDWNGVFCIEGK
jgi:adenylate cyclase